MQRFHGICLILSRLQALDAKELFSVTLPCLNIDIASLPLIVVNGALYVMYSVDVPANQNPLHNLCWRITNGRLELTQNCQVRRIQTEFS